MIAVDLLDEVLTDFVNAAEHGLDEIAHQDAQGAALLAVPVGDPKTLVRRLVIAIADKLGEITDDDPEPVC